MTPDEAIRIEGRLDALGKEVRELTKEVSALTVLVHAPGECDMKKTVEVLKSRSDENKGKVAIITLLFSLASGTIGGVIVGLVVKFWK